MTDAQNFAMLEQGLKDEISHGEECDNDVDDYEKTRNKYHVDLGRRR